MKIAIFGSGGVGGYFGGLLAHAGHDVTFIARGDHLKAIQENGLQVFSINGDFRIHPAQATDDPHQIGGVDYVIVAVKHYHLAEIAPQIRPLLGMNTTVVPLLNGVDAHEILIQALGREPVVGGLCSLMAMIESPGVIRQPSKLQRVVVGELDRRKSERVEKIVQAWNEAGVEAIHADDILVALWAKLLFIASFGGVASLARANIGEIMTCQPARELYIEAMREIQALAHAQAIELDADIIEKTIAFSENFEPTTTSSMQRDVAAGNQFELEAFSGKIVRLGKELGVHTPTHQAIYALLLPAMNRARH
ncbi:MAG: 2-dehydropantoate 2-reductase [Chloroflexi bacterium]|nr:2-dehydropantoate 2-reductase [Chloroflexota bacterium]